MRFLVAGGAALALLLCSGCSSLFHLEAAQQKYYMLPAEALESSTKLPPEDGLRLLVKEPRGEGFISTQRIIFKRDAVEQGYYQSASWVEPPTRKLGQLFTESLSRQSLFRSVSRSANGALGDLQLNSEIVEFYHDASTEPGSVIIRLNADLLNLKTRKIIAQREFVVTAAVGEFSARGAVEAFGKGTNQLLRDLSRWVSELVEHPDTQYQPGIQNQAPPPSPPSE